MKLSTNVMAVVIPVILFAGIGLSAGLNIWETESSKVPAVYKEGEYAGQFNPADIRGSYSLGDIQKSFQVPVEALARAFVREELQDPGTFKVKELEEIYAVFNEGENEIGTDSVRLFVALYRDLPYEPEPTTALPGPAVSQLRQLGTLTDGQVALAEERRVDVSTVPAASAVETHTEDSEDRTIKGKTTFGELLSWGLTAEQIEEVIGGSMGARGTAMRDHFTELGIEFSDYKDKLQALVNAQ
jgi:hypothetical protein